jgi:transposase
LGRSTGRYRWRASETEVFLYAFQVFRQALRPILPCEKQQAFFDAHTHAIAFFGGVFKTPVYDNLTSVVQKVLRGKGRIEHESFRKFHTYYSFQPRFCKARSFEFMTQTMEPCSYSVR